MTEPRISELAAADLAAIWEYIAADNPEAADRVFDAVMASGRVHARFPGMGQNRDDLRPGLRSFVVSPYVAFYRSVDETIEVLRILHAARDIDRIVGSDD